MDQKHRYSLIRLAYIGLDAFFIYLSIFLACWFRQATLEFPVTFTSLLFDETNTFRFIFLLWLFAIIFFNTTYRLYGTRREIFEGVEIWEVAKSVALSALSVVVVLYVFKLEGFPRSVFVLSSAFMIVWLSLWRVLKRFLVSFLVAGGYNNFNAIIIGAGKVGISLAEEIQARPELGIRIVGFLDDFKMGPVEGNKIKAIGKIGDFTQIARREFVTKVFITIHHDSQVFLRLLEEARELGVAVRVVPHGYEFTSGEFSKYNIGVIPILEYCDMENFRKQAGKRLFDFLISSALLIMLLPVFLVIAIAIKLDSKGPVFYASRRYGRKGAIFHMLKFRSMVCEADRILCDLKNKNEVDGPIFKMKNDPRTTKIGCFLRRYSLDELPQIINVIKGEMSLVGPRPLPIEQIEKEDLRQLMRLETRPGITGLWQIRGRSDLPFSRLVKWDIWYINNWSFWLDLNILLQTLPVVVKAKGAY